MNRVPALIFLMIVNAIAAGCVAAGSGGQALQASNEIEICHGYGCQYKSSIVVGAPDARHIGAIMVRGSRSAHDERAAIGQAVAYFDRRAFGAIGIRDEPRSRLGAAGIRGQMDCIDESTNTRSLLLYLGGHHLLRHHHVGMNRSRGFLVDGRYFHSTDVIS